MPPPPQSWQIDPEQTNIAVFIVDYTGAEVKQVYFLQEPPCQEPLPAQTLITHARAALNNTMTAQRMAITLEAGGTLAESLDWQDEFLSWDVHLGDFTAQALLLPCTANAIFAGESIWMGHGVRTFPDNPLPSSALLHLSTTITPPHSLATVGATDFMTMTAEAAWTAIADLNLLHDLVQQPFKTMTLLYRPATGYLEPMQELAHAEWIFIVYSQPSRRAQPQFEHYLPLIRQ